jgi:hypothetical protein
MPRPLRWFVVVSILLTIGCASRVNKTMKSWEGAQMNQLLEKWGPPQQVFDDGSGGRVFVYVFDREFTTPGHAWTHGQIVEYGNQLWLRAYTTYTPPQTNGYTAYRMFWINRQGKIYRWQWRGL